MTTNLLTASLVAGAILVPVAALFKIMHYANADIVLWLGLLVWAVFVITALAEVVRSKHYTRGEKFAWVLAFYSWASSPALFIWP